MSNTLVLLLLFVNYSSQQDPLKDFCRRFGHNTAVVDQNLYIQGGLVNYDSITANPQNITNQFFLYDDLTTSPDGVGMPQLHGNLSTNGSIPEVAGGQFWADDVNKRIFLFGGEYTNTNRPPASTSFLSYDILFDQWEGQPTFNAPPSSIQSVSWGAGVGVSTLGKGFVYGGWLSNDTVYGWSGSPQATTGLVTFDMDLNEWNNLTGPDTVPRAEGVLTYIPASDSGLLIYFGGVTAPYYNETIMSSPMELIYIYDITSSKWYTQNATGNIPPDRRRFCAGASWTEDRSSYNIYIYGGMGFGANETGYDDVWILSLPSFQWIPMYIGDTPKARHHSLSCNVVNSGQMLIIGGTFPDTTDCDSQATWGTHNFRLGEGWGYYKTNLTEYTVPDVLSKVIGGSSSGGASSTAPATGFNSDNGDLTKYFTQSGTAIASRIPTRTASSSSKKLSTGAIAGIAVGGAVVLIAFVLGAFCLLRRRKRRNAAAATQPPAPYPPASIYSQSPLHTHQIPQSPQSPQSPMQQQHYQLPAAVPVELAGDSSPMHPIDPHKNGYFQEAQENHYPQHTGWQGNPPQHSPSTSPQPSYSAVTAGSESNTFESQATSPTPTYSSVGAGQRKPVPVHNTFYHNE